MIEKELKALADDELLARVKTLVVRSNETEAELIAHLAEVDERKLYLPRRTSLWDFCLLELGFSENVANARIAVARESRRHPRMLEMLRAGRIHVSGLRLLCGQLDGGDGDELLDAAAGKSKREIEVLLARRSPKPAVPDRVRKLPSPAKVEQPSASVAGAERVRATPDLPGAELEVTKPPRARAAVVSPLSGEEYRVQFTARDEHMKRVQQAKDLLGHRLPGDLAGLYDLAIQALIEKTLKERFGVGRKPRPPKPAKPGPATSRRVPTALARAVYTPSGGVMHPERDGGRCTFVDPEGRRCDSTAFLQIDHVEGFARTGEHRGEGLRLLCAMHNQHAADVMYGKRWMDRKRARAGESPSPGKVKSTTAEDSFAVFRAAIEEFSYEPR